MAAAAMAAHSLGFDGVQGCIVADPRFVLKVMTSLPQFVGVGLGEGWRGSKRFKDALLLIQGLLGYDLIAPVRRGEAVRGVERQ